MARMIFICTLSVSSLFLNFYLNFFHVADQKWFDNFQRDSESLVIGRMVKSRQDGIFSTGGLLGGVKLNSTHTDLSDPVLNQYKAYSGNIPFFFYDTYKSQIGGQGLLFSILDNSFIFSQGNHLNVFYALTSFFTAIIITSVILWFYLEFGLTVALFVLLSAFFSQWLTVLGRNLFWSIWAYYLPIVFLMYYFRKFKEPVIFNFSRFGVVVFLSVFMKCFFTGYDFITTSLIMMVVPLIYYSFLNRWPLRKFAAGLLTAIISSFLAVFLTFFILCIQIGSVTGNFKNGINHIVISFEKRTYADPRKCEPCYTAALESNTIQVVASYLDGSYFNATNYLKCSNEFISEYFLTLHYKKIILLFMMLSLILYFMMNKSTGKMDKRKKTALILVTWFSFLAPLSWFIIFKAHSFIHTHLNFIVWQMPFTLFGFAVMGLIVQSILPDNE